MVPGQLTQLLLDLVQGEPDPLREDDEGDPAKNGAGEGLSSTIF